MKSAFGSKRKARKIQVDEDEEGANDAGGIVDPGSNCKYSVDATINPADYDKPADAVDIATSKSGQKPFRKSSLRQSIQFDEISRDTNDAGSGDTDKDNNDAQSKSKPTIGRSSCTTRKKKPAASRLSFGPGEIISGDAAEALEDDEAFTSKKVTLGRRVIESNAFRRNLPYQGLSRPSDDDEERPTYSKDYLNELKSSTPSAPKDLKAVHVAEEVGLDASELEGAIVVDMEEKFGPSPVAAFIPSEAEIREKKERRARLAKEEDFISLNDDDDDRRQLSLLPQKKKVESRLVREDEDLGEGFDEFVDDGRISLGRKQEREAKRRQRKEMADMIHEAEGSSDDDSDDSEAERRAAYEAAQTRAGMDGLHKPSDDTDTAVQVPSRITPLPILSECLERLQFTMSTMEQELGQRYKRMADLEQEKREILARETEVQELFKQAGARYSALKVDSTMPLVDPQSIAAGHNGLTEPLIVDRGLESFGNTPTTRPGVEDIG
jgi:hypothetical protein